MTRAQFHHVLLETGPTLSSEIAKLGLIDEVCLTVSGLADIERAKILALEFAKGLGLMGFQIAQAIEVDGSSYLVLNRPIGVA
jgi:riboflavin biosynthesis pyrimidine reductase